jgi:hypothetical protein
LRIAPYSSAGLASTPGRRLGPGIKQTIGSPQRTPSAPASLRLQ